MGSFPVQFFRAVTLLQFISWCRADKTPTIVTVESFERENRGKRFLKTAWDKNTQAFKVSFTGKKEEKETKFIFSSKWISFNQRKTMQLTLRPVVFPNYILAAGKKGLVVKNLSNIDAVEGSSYNFQINTVSLQYDNISATYKILRTRTKPLRVLKSSKSGKVFLDKWRDWKDCQAWFKLQIMP